MEDSRMPPFSEGVNPKIPRKKKQKEKGKKASEAKQYMPQIHMNDAHQSQTKISKRHHRQHEMSNSDSSSGNEYRALRRRYLLLEEESFALEMELKGVEDEVKALEEDKLHLLDQLVVLEGLLLFKNMAFVTTAEVCDANRELIRTGQLRALQPIFQIYGRRQIFSGPIVTVKVFEDNGLIREFLEEKGDGRVLVVDGGGSLRCAILGGNPVVQAQNNGWAGIVVNGCIRDVDEINGCDIGVRALASHPIKANKKLIGERHVPVSFAGARISDGEWLYADTDGILISHSELSV